MIIFHGKKLENADEIPVFGGQNFFMPGRPRGSQSGPGNALLNL